MLPRFSYKIFIKNIQVISNRQNLTVPVSEDSIGTYYCHAEVPGYNTITSRPGADVLMTGKMLKFVVLKNLVIKGYFYAPFPRRFLWLYFSAILKLKIFIRSTKDQIVTNPIWRDRRKHSYQLCSNISSRTWWHCLDVSRKLNKWR